MDERIGFAALPLSIQFYAVTTRSTVKHVPLG